MVPQNNQGGFGVLGFHDLETFIKQRLNHNEPDQLFVLGDEDKNLIRHNIRLSRFRHAPATAREAQSFLKIGFVNEIRRRREDLGVTPTGLGAARRNGGGRPPFFTAESTRRRRPERGGDGALFGQMAESCSALQRE
jgi:hypothetical protein